MDSHRVPPKLTAAQQAKCVEKPCGRPVRCQVLTRKLVSWCLDHCPECNATLLQRASVFATKAHEGQVRKGSGHPYIEHPEAVRRMLEAVGVNDDGILAAAELHDVQEDCGITGKQLRDEFGEFVAGTVFELSKIPERKLSRKAYLQSFRHASVAACLVKLADRTHNLRDTGWKVEAYYIEESRALLEVIRENVKPALEHNIEPWAPWLRPLLQGLEEAIAALEVTP